MIVIVDAWTGCRTLLLTFTTAMQDGFPHCDRPDATAITMNATPDRRITRVLLFQQIPVQNPMPETGSLLIQTSKRHRVKLIKKNCSDKVRHHIFFLSGEWSYLFLRKPERIGEIRQSTTATGPWSPCANAKGIPQ